MKTVNQADICTPIYIAALFTAAKICKELQCLTKDEWRRCDIYAKWNTKQLSKDETLSFVTLGIELERIMLSGNKSEGKRYTHWMKMNSLICGVQRGEKKRIKQNKSKSKPNPSTDICTHCTSRLRKITQGF